MRRKLLLADDSVTIQRVIELTFADEDIKVVAVSDGEAAIARLQSEPFDIVLADIGMPKRGGYEVAEFVRDSPSLAGLPVLLLTGAFEPVDEARVARVGAAGVLAKPFEPQLVIARVRELLRKGRGPASPAPAPPADLPAADALLAAPPAPPSAPSVDDYFAQLDKAFANLTPTLTPRDPALPPAAASPSPPPPQAPSAPMPSPAASELIVEHTSQTAASSAEAHPPAPPAETRQPAPPVETGQPMAPAEPSGRLAEAFTTLLAVERGELPASALEEATGTPITEELVDRLARRVAERLADGAVRELAADIVSRTAERLVREEIDRIKSGLPGNV